MFRYGQRRRVTASRYSRRREPFKYVISCGAGLTGGLVTDSLMPGLTVLLLHELHLLHLQC